MTASDPKALPLGHEFLSPSNVPEAQYGICSFPTGCHHRGENLAWCHEPEAAHLPAPSEPKPIGSSGYLTVTNEPPPVTLFIHEFVACWDKWVGQGALRPCADSCHYKTKAHGLCGRPASEHRSAVVPQQEPKPGFCSKCGEAEVYCACESAAEAAPQQGQETNVSPLEPRAEETAVSKTTLESESPAPSNLGERGCGRASSPLVDELNQCFASLDQVWLDPDAEPVLRVWLDARERDARRDEREKMARENKAESDESIRRAMEGFERDPEGRRHDL